MYSISNFAIDFLLKISDLVMNENPNISNDKWQFFFETIVNSQNLKNLEISNCNLNDEKIMSISKALMGLEINIS